MYMAMGAQGQNEATLLCLSAGDTYCLPAFPSWLPHPPCQQGQSCRSQGSGRSGGRGDVTLWGQGERTVLST